MIATQGYTVGQAPSTAPKRVAVFIAHGMGQQVPFQTMDSVATGLWKQDGSPTDQKPTARAVKVKDDWIHRLEMPMKNKAVDVHVYEAYWAPLTEGRITLRDVIRFLVSAGLNALRNSRNGTYQRWLFGDFKTFAVSMRTVFYLLVTLAAVLSLVVMNSAIVSISAATALLGTRPRWLSEALLADVTTTFNGVVAAMAVAAVALGVGLALRGIGLHWKARFAWSIVATIAVIGAIFIVILAGIAIPILFYGHIRGGATSPIWPLIFDDGAVPRFDGVVATVIFWLTILAVGFIVGRWVLRILFGLIRDLFARKGVVGTLLVSIFFAALTLMIVWLVLRLRGAIDSFSPSEVPIIVTGSLVWVLLVVASGYVRTVLVQFLGDVAIYVMPYKLDAFNALRREIRACSFKTLRAIYDMVDANGNKLYDNVIIIGHSLGSVVSYDALNQMLRDDEAAEKSDVVARTSMLVTFGSPLDKTAFIFSLQGRDTSEPREALAASVQPMIRDYKFRPNTWLNIWTPWDIISGHLGFYDPDPPTDPKSVRNEVDVEATTPIIAHTEYWKGTLVYQRVYAAL